MKDDTMFDSIEAWLSGELSKPEAQAFEAKMANDPALAQEVARHRKGREALDEMAVRARQQDIARWQSTMDDIPAPPSAILPNKKPGNWSQFNALYLILSLLLAVGGYWFWSQKFNPPLNSTQQAPLQPNKETVPMANTSPMVPDSPITTPPANKIIDPQQPTEANSSKLIAMAETNMRDFRTSVLNNYDSDRGRGGAEVSTFSAGLKAFQSTQPKTAEALLLKIKADDPYFSAAQEMLASLYFSEKKYGKAVRSYEFYARENDNANTDLRLLHFYLADYDHQKVAFWKKTNEMLNPAKPHEFRSDVEKLKAALQKMGVSDSSNTSPKKQ